jgi:hypothetical protein
MRHRRIVVGSWIALTVFGVFATAQLSSRWFEQFSIPGFSAFEANQRTLHTFGSGEEAPNIAVLTVKGDVTTSAAVRATLARVSSALQRVGGGGDVHPWLALIAQEFPAGRERGTAMGLYVPRSAWRCSATRPSRSETRTAAESLVSANA